MKRITTTRAKRSTAWLMLCVWLFYLTSGMANACVLAALGMHLVPMATDIQHEVANSAHSDDVASAHSRHHDGDKHDSKTPCRKACDDGSLSLYPALPE